MIRKVLILWFALTGLVCTTQAQWSGYATPITTGDGTVNNPYLIETAEQLAYVSQQLYTGATDYAGQYLKLTSDLNMSNRSWEPIGTTTYPFRGNFDGDGHTIDDLYVHTVLELTSPRYILGLFGTVENGLVENLNLTVEVSVEQGNGSGLPLSFHVGGIVGALVNGTVRNCNVEGYVECGFNTQSRTITKTAGTGGAVGGARNSFLQNITNRCTVMGATSWVGGIVGYLDTCDVYGCRNLGNVIGQASINPNQRAMMAQDLRVGGICGYTKRMVFILQCQNSGDVSAISFQQSARIAGISCGLSATAASIEYCYNTGAVHTSYSTSNITNDEIYVYGIGIGDIANCYNTGAVSTPTNYSHRYAIKAKAANSPTYMTGNNYYREGCLGAMSYDTNQYGVPTDSMQMKTSGFVAMLNSGSSVYAEDIYNINNGYPVFVYELPPPQYTLTAMADDEEHGTVSGGGVYEEGEVATLTAEAEEGYHFTQWNDGNTQNPRQVTLTQDTVFMASFAIDRYLLTVESSNPVLGSVQGGGMYDYLTQVSIRATPGAHGHFVQWADGESANPRTVTVRSDTTFRAMFVGDPQYTISVGTNDATLGSVSGGGTYFEGETVTLTATAAAHSHFVEWSDGESTNPRQVTLTCDTSFTAMFEVNPQYTISVGANEETMGSVSGGGTYYEGETVTLTATAAAHYRFVQWSDGESANPRTVTVTGDASYTAVFEPIVYTVTVTASNYAMGQVSGGGVYREGEVATLTAEANEGYRFTQWGDGITQNPRSIVVTSDLTMTAYFVSNSSPTAIITVLTSDETAGNVSGGGEYEIGTDIVIKAIANDGYQFTRWNDGNSDNPRVITVDGSHTYMAYFAATEGIEEAEKRLRLMPNPATDRLEIGGLEPGEEVELYSMEGHRLGSWKSTGECVAIDVRRLPRGTYVVRGAGLVRLVVLQ